VFTHKKISSNVPNKRKLYYLPIVHTQTDMGDLSSVLRDSYVKKKGPASLAKEETNNRTLLERACQDRK